MEPNEQREVDSSSDSRPSFHLRMWQRLKKLIIRLAAISIVFAATGYVLLCCYLVWNETDLVYPAAMDSYGANLQFEPSAKLVSVQYETDDGVKLTGRLLERPGCTRYVVFFHGNGERAKWLDDWAITLSKQWDASVLVAEYRGFDDSQYQPTEVGVIADGMAASEFMCQQFDLQSAQII